MPSDVSVAGRVALWSPRSFNGHLFRSLFFGIGMVEPTNLFYFLHPRVRRPDGDLVVHAAHRIVGDSSNIDAATHTA
jgi:hypothetical protein